MRVILTLSEGSKGRAAPCTRTLATCFGPPFALAHGNGPHHRVPSFRPSPVRSAALPEDLHRCGCPCRQHNGGRAIPAIALPLVVNLLHHTDAQVTLSSRVDNPRDYPEHLVDGKPGTAWNSKTGDQHAWIEAKLDPQAHVTAIEITPGFDKGDLFEKNLRIKKLRIEHDGALLKDVELDPNERRPKHVTLDSPGGTLKLTVLDTAPRTNKAWKEVVISELRVLRDGAAEWCCGRRSRLPKMARRFGQHARRRFPRRSGGGGFGGRTGASLAEI